MVMSRASPPTRLGTRGVVMLEFLLAFTPVLWLFLGIMQLALLASARIIVQHAAISGARAAAVVLDDDPQFYAGAPRMFLGRADARDSRWHAIRRATLIPVELIAKDQHGPFAAEVTLPVAPRSTERIKDGARIDGRVTLRVRQLVRCAIPLVGALMCERASAAVGPTRVVAIEAEATFPLQRAVYRYASERGEQDGKP
jgi:hypothetical protein